jgi:hypothetical protein
LIKELGSLALPRKEALILMSIPIVIDTAGNLFLLWTTNEWVRLLIGLLWGSILPFFLIPGMMDVVRNKLSPTEPVALSLNQITN